MSAAAGSGLAAVLEELAERWCSGAGPAGDPRFAPYTYELAGVRWVVAANRAALIAIRAPAEAEFGRVPRLRSGPFLQLHGHLSREVAGQPVDLNALRRWLGAPEWPARVPCGNCGGTGSLRCTCTCGDGHQARCRVCDGGKVRVEPDARPGRLFGRRIDRNLLARALHFFPAVEGRIDADLDLLFVYGPAWRVVVACLAPEGPAADDPAWTETAEVA